jgi:hypothetical protein
MSSAEPIFELPENLREALESGELTQDQLRQLIEKEAAFIGLDYAQAVKRARDRTLPPGVFSDDIEMLVAMLSE